MVEAVVLSFDSESKKISLGVIQLEENPWAGIESSIKVSDIHKGKVANIVQNGAYVCLDNDLEGFLSINDISWTRKIRNASDILNQGDKLELMILDVSSKDKKILLGLKQINVDPWLNINELFNIDDTLQG